MFRPLEATCRPRAAQAGIQGRRPRLTPRTNPSSALRENTLAAACLGVALLAPISAFADPVVLFTDLLSGPTSGGPGNHGVPLSIFGSGFGTARGVSRVTIGGVEVASYLVWGANNANNAALDMIVVQPGASVTGGPIVVTVGGVASNADHAFAANSGRLLYVATDGDDSNDGSQAAPFATIQHAAGNAMSDPGDTILIRGGTYNEGEIWLREEFGDGGTNAQRKTIKNYPSEEVFLPNSARDFYVDAGHLTVSGLHFRNGKSLGMYDRENGTGFRDGERFINNTFRGVIVYDAIGTHGSHHLIAGNVVEVSNSTQGTQGHCFYISVGSDIRLLYNVAAGAPGYGIHIFDQFRGSATRPDYQRVIRNVVVEGNILRNSTRRSGLIVAMGDEGGYGNYIDDVLIRNNIFTANNHDGIVIRGIARNIRIFNNTFYQNGRQGIFIASEPSLDDVTIRGNLFYQSPNGNCLSECSFFDDAHLEIDAGPTAVAVANNAYFPGPPVVLGASDAAPVTGSVLFADPQARDFRLRPGDDAIDAVPASAEVPRDYFGLSRPQGSAADAGAFELHPACTALVGPHQVSVCPGQNAAYSVSFPPAGSVTYQWQLEDRSAEAGRWHSLGNDPLPLPGGGAAFASPLNAGIVNVGVTGRSGTFGVRCVIGNLCGSTVSLPARLHIQLGPAGDLNCDGFVTIGDIGPFVQALLDPPAYDAALPACDIYNADMNCDGFVTVADIGPFVALLTGN